MPCLVVIVGGRESLNTWYSSRPGLGNAAFKPAPMPTSRWRLAAAPLGAGLIGVFGGFDGTYYLATNEVYEYAANVWTTRASMPTARTYIAAAPLGPGLAGVFGAYGSGNPDVNEVYNYASNSWASRAPMPTGRHGLAAAPLGPGLAGVFGGFRAGALTRNEIYDHSTNTWTTRASMPTARAELAAGPLGSGLVGVFGGRPNLDNSWSDLSQNELYDYYANAWLTRAPMPTARSGTGVAELDYGVVAVVGGRNNNVNEIYVY